MSDSADARLDAAEAALALLADALAAQDDAQIDAAVDALQHAVQGSALTQPAGGPAGDPARLERLQRLQATIAVQREAVLRARTLLDRATATLLPQNVGQQAAQLYSAQGRVDGMAHSSGWLSA